ncbi:P-loop containing nucleoside triphosphate hydrolase protein [Suillus decipiens]|nr:P-loop containing nucleoside triphosphate hydrolase protein [Suillus decipiens]
MSPLDQNQIEPSHCSSSAHASEWQTKVRTAFQVLFKDPAAKEKSTAQLKAIVSVMTIQQDILVTLKTGGGKSALWMISPLIDPDQRCIVVCPFVVLLEEQVSKCCALGLRAHNFTKDKEVPDNVQILFLQVETCSAMAFREFLETPFGNSFKKIFIDECHDMIMCHPERKRPWELLASQFSRMNCQIILLSATFSPAITAAYIQPFGIHLSQLHEVRSCTDRPEIGFHVLRVLPSDANGALHLLVAKLQTRMARSDRMLVFFSSNREADEFGAAISCAVFHSGLPTMGENSKADNLDKWDSGKTKVMACTTAFAQGIDRSSIRFVVINGVEYGLPVVNQMAGRAGRDGKEAHAFYLTCKTEFGAFTSDLDFDSTYALQDVVFGTTCRRYTSISCMDGPQFAYCCKNKADVMQCDICGPTAEVHVFALNAIRGRWNQLATGHIVVPSAPSSSSSGQGQDRNLFRLSQTRSGITKASAKEVIRLCMFFNL